MTFPFSFSCLISRNRIVTSVSVRHAVGSSNAMIFESRLYDFMISTIC